MPTIWRSRVTLTANSVSSLMSFYWDFGAIAPNTAATEALARVRACLNGAGAGINSVASVVFDPNVQGFNDATGQLTAVGVGALPAAPSFTGAGDTIPGMVQGLARYQTGQFLNGRSWVGRAFLPGVTEGMNSATGQPTAAYVTAWNTGLGLLSTTVVSAITQVVWHRPVNGAGGQFTPVTGRSTASTWATLRSRRV